VKKKATNPASAKAPIARRITSEFNFAKVDHLADFQTCAECDHRAADFDKWKANAKVLVLTCHHGKHGSAVVVMECPNCGSEHWVHAELDSLSSEWYDWPAEWRKPADQYRKRLLCESARAFAASQCSSCIHLSEPKVTTHPWRECAKHGSGPGCLNCPDYIKAEAPLHLLSSRE